MNNKIILYPTSWLYNASVVGLIQIHPKYFQFKDNLALMDCNIFSEIDPEDYFNNEKVVNLIGKNEFYPNFIDSRGNQKKVFKEFVKALSGLRKNGICDICGISYFIDEKVFQHLYNLDRYSSTFLEKISKFDLVHNKILGPSYNEFPNSFWGLNQTQSLKICHLCAFLLIHHHLSFTKLSDASRIFINSPSFKLMYELNLLVKSIYGQKNEIEIPIRDILAISLIEYSRKLTVALSHWLTLNIEIVVRTDDKIDFFSLPSEVAKLITDREIAALLTSIGESLVLKIILNQNYGELIDLGYKILRIGLKNNIERNKSDNDFINKLIKMKKNRDNLTKFAQELLTLYSLIDEKLKEY
jgi:CRISPR-associated protein Cst1